jgi:hypothetical protein
MDDKQYAKRALILALTAFAIATFPITIPVLTIFISIGLNVPIEGYLKYIYGCLIFFSWIPGLIIAIIAHKMCQHIKGSLLIMNTTHITAVLAFLGNLGFGIFSILALLINHYFPANF